MPHATVNGLQLYYEEAGSCAFSHPAALAESGMAGPPDGERRSLKNGESWLALAGPQGVKTRMIRLNPFLTRREHQLRFAREALDWVRKRVE